jgi:asparagine synthetase A
MKRRGCPVERIYDSFACLRHQHHASSYSNPACLALFVSQHVTPLAFQVGTGVNDELDGSASKSAVRFTVPNVDVPRGIAPEATGEQQPATSSSSSSSLSPPPYEMECEVVQSLAKWKRLMLGRLDCPVGTGIYCDSTSIRKGYKGDVTHSVIADQWGTCVLSCWTTQR